MKPLKVALVHDYLNDFGGAERVLAALTEIYPNAPIYTIYCKSSSPAGQYFKDQKIIQSWFSYLPFADKLISPLRFLIPFVWIQFDFSEFDLVITSASWAVTKGMRNAKREICYLHTPPRYLYGYDTSRNWKGKWYAPAVDTYALIVNHFMRIYDFKQAQKVGHFIVNSGNVGERVKKFYRRSDYTIVHPPVDTNKFETNKPRSYQLKARSYFLTGGRMTAAKNFDLIIKACQKANVTLKVFGNGIEENNLRNHANENTEFLGRVSDGELVTLYQNAKAFIVAQADAAGTPVIAYKGGGYLETVVDGQTGLFFDELSVNSLAKALKNFGNKKFDPKKLQLHAQNFSKENFITKFKKTITSYN